MAEQSAVATLNSLIETCRDGEKGFREAAEHVRDPQVRSLFTSIATERAQFAEELQQEVRRLGGEPEQGSSVAGAIHRGWMNLRSAVGRNDAALISEAERGEDVAVSSYRSALEAPLPGEAHRIVQRQFGEVKEAHDRVRELERMRSRDA
jgi:uncharacterized protein (TIGR02284 family)